LAQLGYPGTDEEVDLQAAFWGTVAFSDDLGALEIEGRWRPWADDEAPAGS
jgi:hypothetical protein